ncbi:MAG: hypothetical protein H6712_28250 [Myxococcales bacterium]|nr:hypothetical protein [Myxococcales bacterium]
MPMPMRSLVLLAATTCSCIVRPPSEDDPTGSSSDSTAADPSATSVGPATEASTGQPGTTTLEDPTTDATGRDTHGTTSGGSEGETTSGDGTSSEGGSESSGDTGEPLGPPCGVWFDRKTRARGLDRVWTDGMAIVAGGDIDLVESDGSGWVDHDEHDSDYQIRLVSDVWGPVGDHWLLASKQAWGEGVFHFDGTQVTADTLFPPLPGSSATIPVDLAGSGPADVWALALADCNTFECYEDPGCACNSLPSAILHYDGVGWTAAPSPGRVHRLWTDGAQAWAVGDGAGGGGLIARWDGIAWSPELEGVMPPLRAVWSPGGDEAWAAGEGGSLLHRVGGLWALVPLATTETIVALEGRSASELWALSEGGELWAFDGASWSLLVVVPQARDLGVLDTGLVVVGEDGGHWIAEIDPSTAMVTPLYTRAEDLQPWALHADHMADAVASDPASARSWRWDGTSWSATYPGLGVGFEYLVGEVDEGWGVRSTAGVGGAAVWSFNAGVGAPLPDPVGVDAYYADPVVVGGNLWVAGRTELDTHFVASREGGAWIDRTPVVPGAYGATNLSAAGGRVFVELWRLGLDAALLYHEGGIWTDIGNPGVSHPYDILATAPDELWLTGFVSQSEGQRLFHWDGASWSRADDTWPALAGEDGWWVLGAAALDDAWVVSSHFFRSEALAHWDGTSWTMVSTPPNLHGWGERQRLLLAPTTNGLFVHDGLRLWGLAECGS